MRISAATLGLLSSVVGRHRGFGRESNGRLIHSVAPVPVNRDLQISSSRAVELELHTELAYAAHMPDFVLLLCVKSGLQAPATLVAPLVDVVEELSERAIVTLGQRRFMTSVDIVVAGRPEETVGPVPILTPDGFGGLRFRCDFGEVEATDGESRDALAALRRGARARARPVVLDAGDLLVLDNRRALHGRLPFEARFDGSDRWLLRSYVWEVDGSDALADDPVVPGTLIA